MAAPVAELNGLPPAAPAYRRLFRSNDERPASLPRWLDAYNRGRPHAGLEGQTPMAVLVNKVDGNDN